MVAARRFVNLSPTFRGWSGTGLTERRRSRTDRAVGYTTAQVLKTCWATGPVPLRRAGYMRVLKRSRAWLVPAAGAAAAAVDDEQYDADRDDCDDGSDRGPAWEVHR